MLYNGAKLPAHPVATLRLKNETGLTLERGPVTVLEAGEYVGEAVLPFTAEGGEVTVPYAVELGVKVREQNGSRREIHGLNVQGAYLHIEEWEIRWREYQLNNSTRQDMAVLVEHRRTAHYALFDTPDPKERTSEHMRFEVKIPAQGEAVLRVQERRLVSRREGLQKQSYAKLQRYLRHKLLDRDTHDHIAELLGLWEKVAKTEQQLKEVEKDRQKIYKAQQQIQGNMGALSSAGKEGRLRARYVDELENSEQNLKELAAKEAALKTSRKRLEEKIKALLEKVA